MTLRHLSAQEINTDNILSTISGIDAKVIAITDLYTVPTDKTAVITSAVIKTESIIAISGVPTVGIGRNVTQDDIFFPTALTGLTSTSAFIFPSIGTIALANPGETIRLGIDVAAIGTQMIINVALSGYLI